MKIGPANGPRAAICIAIAVFIQNCIGFIAACQKAIEAIIGLYARNAFARALSNRSSRSGSDDGNAGADASPPLTRADGRETDTGDDETLLMGTRSSVLYVSDLHPRACARSGERASAAGSRRTRDRYAPDARTAS